MQGWFLITHNFHGFQLVTEKLKALGVEVYSPTRCEVKKRRDCNAVRITEKQLFPGYLFLRFDFEQVHTTTISDLPGVKGFVRFGNIPAIVSDAIIEDLKQSLLLLPNQAVTCLELRNLPPDMQGAWSAIVEIKSELQRQAALFSLLQKDHERLLKLGNLPYSRICSSIDSDS